MSTAKSLFIRRESDVWESLRSQRAALAEANERLAQRSAEVANLRLLCDELKSEAAARTEAASARTKASSAREHVASQAEEVQRGGWSLARSSASGTNPGVTLPRP